MSEIRIIKEGESIATTSILKESWTDDQSFIFVPEKTSVSHPWLSRASHLLSEQFCEGCFGLLSSGTTGEPKLIIGEKKRSERLTRLLHALQESEPVAETICALPLSYSYAFVNQWLWSHLFNRKLRNTRGFSEPDTLQSKLADAQDAMLCLVGSQVALINRYFPEATYPGIIRLHFAGGRFPQEQLDLLRKRFPFAKIFNNYGCAEAMPRLTIRTAEDADEAPHIGWAIPGVELKSNSDRHLLFRSPYRAIAYFDDAGIYLLDDKEWVPTGDLGTLQEDGSWKLLGRANEVFKRFGEKISLARILTTVKSCWSGNAAFYQQIDPGGELAYVLVLSPQPSNKQLREVLMGFRKNYTRSHWPIRIESMDQLPILANGKPDLMGLEAAEGKNLHWKQRI